MSALPRPLALWRAGRVWLRDPGRALALYGERTEGLSGPQLGLRSWLALIYERDEATAERLARAALEQGGDTRFASATLTEVLLRRGAHDEAIEVIRAGQASHPDVPWYQLTLADALEDAGRVDEAIEVLQAAATGPPLRRHAVKRLSRIALERSNDAEALRWFGELVGLAPDYLVYASDYVTLARLQLKAGDRDTAHETLTNGARIYPRNDELNALRAEHFGESEALSKPRIAPVSEERMGITRIPVRTPMIGPRTGLIGVLEPATAGVREPGDTIALAESAAAAGQGRILPLELMDAGPLAHRLSGFVGKIGPLHSPEGMQGAIMEAGRPRVLAGALAGGVLRLLGRSGWFYRIAGPRTAMIDDVAACMPPNDHHVIFGPLAPGSLSQELAGELGCGVAVVDANHRTGAWVIDASPGVDREWLRAALMDNPAGNEDEQTPIVIVRPRASAAPAP